MEKPLQCVHGIDKLEKVNFFGVTHLSPACSVNLIKKLEEVKPKIILIEGPIDATQYIDTITSKKVKLPIGILSYTNDLPVRSVVFPLATYSPEYQAMVWAKNNRVKSMFFDLPSSATVGYYSNDDVEKTDDEQTQYYNYLELQDEAFHVVASEFSENNYASYWESIFEQEQDVNKFCRLVKSHSGEIRKYLEPIQEKKDNADFLYNKLRERYMISNICEQIENGVLPQDIFVITGSYHLEGLVTDTPLTKSEYDNIHMRDTSITLMPYSFYKLSSMSGYGAGNHAPAYYELLFDFLKSDKLEDMSSTYLSMLNEHVRKRGNSSSTASVIEATRLAKALAVLKNHRYPIYEDLKDAAVTCIGGGEYTSLVESFAMINVGIKIGYVEEGVKQTPIQDDFNRQLKSLKLEKYKTVVHNELDLDLRENLTVKSKDSAFIGLNRSIFFSKLNVLNISFAKKLRAKENNGNWSEKWDLHWSPEVEIEIIESMHKGETIDIATSHELNDSLKNSKTVEEIADVINKAYLCSSMNIVTDAINVLEDFFKDNDIFIDAAVTCINIGNIISFKTLRKINIEVIIPIFVKLFNRSALLLDSASNCNNEFAHKNLIATIDSLYLLSQKFSDIIDSKIFIKQLKKVAFDDSKNSIVSGVCFSILMEKQMISNDKIKNEIQLRLNVGTPADLAASWFEGVSVRNKYSLLSHTILWEELDNYLTSLDENDFKRALVFLRRTFATYKPREKNNIVELLASLWNVESYTVAKMLETKLSDAEESIISELDDFDFEDLL